MQRRRLNQHEPLLPKLTKPSPQKTSRGVLTGSFSHPTQSASFPPSPSYEGVGSSLTLPLPQSPSVFKFPRLLSRFSSALDLDADRILPSPLPQFSRLQPSKSSSSPVVRGSDQFNCVRMCLYRTFAGHSETAKNEVNQDAFLIQAGLQSLMTQYCFGVFDGHGTYGHHISQFLKRTCPKAIEEQMFKHDDLQGAVKAGIKVANEALKSSKIEHAYSGSTLNLVVIRNDSFVCANIGDSRAVLGRKSGKDWTAVDLSREHRPCDPAEKARIEQARGIVTPLVDDHGSPVGQDRVWAPGRVAPGLAISRSVGDRVAHSIGVTDEPDCLQGRLQPGDKFILLATDGLWECVSSERAAQLVGAAIDSGRPEAAINDLLEEVRTRKVVDDTTLILVLLK